MSTKEVVHTLIDDPQELQKQLGCMNGLFQLFDRRYLLGQRRRSHNQKRLPPPPGTTLNFLVFYMSYILAAACFLTIS